MVVCAAVYVSVAGDEWTHRQTDRQVHGQQDPKSEQGQNTAVLPPSSAVHMPLHYFTCT